MVFPKNRFSFSKSFFCLLFFFPTYTPAKYTSARGFSSIQEALPIILAGRSVWMLSNSSKAGTGFFLSPRLLVTNFHVVDDLLESGDLSDITLSQNGKGGGIKIKRILQASAVRDIALLETDKDAPFYLSLRAKPLSENEDVFALGYPSAAFRIMKNTTSIEHFRNRMAFFIDHTGINGASGSPIVDSQGFAAGILYHAGENKAIATDLDQLKKILKEAGDAPCGKDSPERCLKRSFDLALKTAEEGDVLAQFRVGQMYWEGGVMGRDFKKATLWFGQAARLGNTEAQHKLGRMYLEGSGLERDIEKAVDWLSQAAKLGNAEAQHDLGFMYWEGYGVEKDLEKAIFFLKRAAEQGYVQTQHGLGMIYWKDLGVKRDPEEAALWFGRAAEQGHAQAQHNLGFMYWKGLGVKRDPEEAIFWLKQAAEQGYAQAQHNLGFMYWKGLGVKRDPKEAALWFERAAEQGYAAAQNNLGIMYGKGLGVKRDPEEAALWFGRAEIISGYSLRMVEKTMRLWDNIRPLRLYERAKGCKAAFSKVFQN